MRNGQEVYVACVMKRIVCSPAREGSQIVPQEGSRDCQQQNIGEDLQEAILRPLQKDVG